MKRKGIHKPTIEDTIELSGLEILHPGGHALTKRTAELAELRKGLKVLDVSSGRGTLAIYYAKGYGVIVTGIDISDDMVKTATENVKRAGLQDMINFEQGDSQNLPFEDNTFDAVINECAVGIPDDSQKVLDEMVRVAKPNGKILIHESTWRKKLPMEERVEFAERYGTTPLEFNEWLDMLKKAGAKNITYEFDEWSKPEMFWKIREDRDVKHRFFTMTISERLKTVARIYQEYGLKGVLKAMQNERILFKAVLSGKIGYCLFKGEK